MDHFSKLDDNIDNSDNDASHDIDEGGELDIEEEISLDENDNDVTFAFDQDEEFNNEDENETVNESDSQSSDFLIEPFWKDILKPNENEKKSILSLDFNNGLLVAGGEDDKGYLIHTDDSINPVMNIEEFKDSVISVKFSPDGNLIAMASLDGQLKLLDRNGNLVHTFEIDSDMNWIEWHPKGKAIAVGASDGSTWILNAVNYTCLYIIPPFSTDNQCGTFTQDGSRLIVASKGIIIIFDIRSGERFLVYKFDSLSTDEFTFIQVHSTLSLFALGTDSGKIIIASTLNQQIIKILEDHTDSIESLIFSLKNLYSCSMDGKVNIWDVSKFDLKITLNHRKSILLPLTSSPSLDSTMMNEEGQDRREYNFEEGVNQMFLLSNKTIVTTGTSGCIRVWDLLTCAITKEYQYLPNTPCMSLVKGGEIKNGEIKERTTNGTLNETILWASFNDGVILSFKVK